MPAIEYIGAKPRKTDNVANTGAVWQGHGDVQEVSTEAAGKLLAYPQIWRIAEPVKQPSADSAAKQDASDKKALLDEAIALGCKDVDGRSSVKKIVDAIDARKAEIEIEAKAKSAGMGE